MSVYDPKAKRPWLLMVYMNADAPNLEGPIEADLDELRRALQGADPAARARVHVVVQVNYPSGISKRHRLTAKKAHPLWAGPTPDEGPLTDFAANVAKPGGNHYHNGRKRALVVWGHAAGVGESLEGTLGFATAASGTLNATFGISSTILSGPGHAAPELEGLDLDIVGFDACFMSMIEIAYELKGAAKYLLAPQAAIGLEGWHYDLLLDHILHNTDPNGDPIEPLKLGKAVVEQVGVRRSSPQSLTLMDLSKVDAARDAFKALVKAVRDALANPLAEMGLRHQVLAAFEGTLWAGARQFLDLADLCHQLAGRIPVPSVREKAAALLSALSGPDRLVVDQLTSLELPLGGVSLYNPWPRATSHEVDQGVRNVEIDVGDYLTRRFVKDTDYFWLLLNPNNFVAAERRWVRREVRDGMAAMIEAYAPGATREPGPKPAGREPGPKPAGREPGPKPAGRGDDAGRFRPDGD